MERVTRLNLPRAFATATSRQQRLAAMMQAFHLSTHDAARALGITHSQLKREGRLLGIECWPSRKLAVLKELMEGVDDDDLLTPANRRSLCDHIVGRVEMVYEVPNASVDRFARTLRHSQRRMRSGGDDRPVEAQQASDESDTEVFV
jgi:hypothetical protein